MKIDKVELAELIGEAVGVSEFDQRSVDTLLAIARGIYWDEDLASRVEDLANDIRDALSIYNNIPE